MKETTWRERSWREKERRRNLKRKVSRRSDWKENVLSRFKERESRAREDQAGKKARDALLAFLASKKDSLSSTSFQTLFSVHMLYYSLSQSIS